MSKKRPKRKAANLILSVAEPQRGVDEGEEDREDHSGEKDQDAAKLEEQIFLTFERRKLQLWDGSIWSHLHTYNGLTW